MGILDVLELIKLPSFLNLSTFSNICLFTSSFSMTTSIIQSASFIFSKSSSKFPVLILFMKLLEYNGAGFDFTAFCNELLTKKLREFLSFFASLGTISNIRTSIPTFAK